VFVWDLKVTTSGGGAAPGHTEVRQLKHHKDPVVAAAWSSDSITMVSADKAGVVAFWALQ